MNSASNIQSPTLLFVYGTLRADVRHPLHTMIRAHARDLGPGVFQGRLYDLGAYPGVVDSDDAAELVFGEIFELVGDARLLFERLDAYEECGPDFQEPTEYVRAVRPVRLVDSSEQMQAWLYLYNHPLDNARRIAHGDYLKR